MNGRIRIFDLAADTVRHVLIVTWYRVRRIWSRAETRGFRISSERKSRRLMRIADAQANNDRPACRS